MTDRECLDKLNVILQTFKDEYGIDMMLDFIRSHGKRPCYYSRIFLADDVKVDVGEITPNIVKDRICESLKRIIDLLQQSLEKLGEPK